MENKMNEPKFELLEEVWYCPKGAVARKAHIIAINKDLQFGKHTYKISIPRETYLELSVGDIPEEQLRKLFIIGDTVSVCGTRGQFNECIGHVISTHSRKDSKQIQSCGVKIIKGGVHYEMSFNVKHLKLLTSISDYSINLMKMDDILQPSPVNSIVKALMDRVVENAEKTIMKSCETNPCPDNTPSILCTTDGIDRESIKKAMEYAKKDVEFTSAAFDKLMANTGRFSIGDTVRVYTTTSVFHDKVGIVKGYFIRDGKRYYDVDMGNGNNYTGVGCTLNPVEAKFKIGEHVVVHHPLCINPKHRYATVDNVGLRCGLEDPFIYDLNFEDGGDGHAVPEEYIHKFDEPKYKLRDYVALKMSCYPGDFNGDIIAIDKVNKLYTIKHDTGRIEYHVPETTIARVITAEDGFILGEKVTLDPQVFATVRGFTGTIMGYRKNRHREKVYSVKFTDGQWFENVEPKFMHKIKEDKKMKTEKDLRMMVEPGMLVVRHDGGVFLIQETASGVMYMSSKLGSAGSFINMYNKNLKAFGDDHTDGWDIVQIWDNPTRMLSITDLMTTKYRTLLWEREPEAKEMTVAEIEKELGHKVKIVKE